MGNMFRALFAAALIFASVDCQIRPASALERLVLELPFLEAEVTLDLGREESSVDLLTVNPEKIKK